MLLSLWAAALMVLPGAEPLAENGHFCSWSCRIFPVFILF